MSNSYVNPNKNTNNASGRSSASQNTPPPVNVKKLQNELTNLYELLSDIRSTDSNSSSSSSKSSNYSSTKVSRESNYLSRIYEIQGELERATKSSSNNNSGELSGANSSFGDFFNAAENGFKSFFDNVSNGFSSLTEGIGNGLKSLGEAAGKAVNWFVSQVPGFSNMNEDGGFNNSNCGFACLEMIYRKNGKDGNAMSADSDIEQIRADAGITDENEGALPEDLARAARKRGLDAQSMNGNLDDAINQLNGGKDVILAVDPAKYKPGYQNGGHAVVLESVDLE